MVTPLNGDVLMVRRGVYPGYDFPEVHQFAEELVKLGKRVTILCLASPGESPNERLNGVVVRRLVPDRILYRWFFPLILILSLRGQHYQVAHVFWGKGMFAIPVLVRGIARKWILDVRSGYVGSFFLSILINGLIAFESYFFDHVVTLDERLAHNIWRFLPRPRHLSFVPMGVNTDIFRFYYDRRLAASLGISREDLVLVYQGTLGESRKLDVFLKGFAIAEKEIRNLKLLVVGGADRDRAILERLVHELGVSEKTIFMGRVPFSEVPKYISLGSVGISYVPQNKVFESQQVTKTLEYLACGRPVLATRIPFHQDLFSGNFGFREGREGILTGDDSQSVAAAIARVAHLHREGRIKVDPAKVKNFSWLEIVRRDLLPFYQDPITNRNV